MTCYQVNLISVTFKVENISIFEQAAKALGWAFQRNGNLIVAGRVMVNLSQGKAQSSSQEAINQLKRQYSVQAVKLASKAKGWVLESWKEKAGVKTTIAIKF